MGAFICENHLPDRSRTRLALFPASLLSHHHGVAQQVFSMPRGCPYCWLNMRKPFIRACSLQRKEPQDMKYLQTTKKECFEAWIS